MSTVAKQMSLSNVPDAPEVGPLPEQEISVEVLVEKYAKGKETSVHDVRRRVALALAANEEEKNRAHWEAKFLWAQENGFVPAGRINSAAGTDLAGGLRFTSSVSLIVEPAAGSTPILSAIRNAKSSIALELYLLTDSSFTGALVAARKAGRDVRVLLEQGPTGVSNNTSYAALQAGGVPVKWASNAYPFTHAKALIVDGATLYNMTCNLSVSAFTDNREYVLVDTDPSDVAEASAVFEADWAMAATPPVSGLVISPTTARPKLEKLLAGAAGRLDIEWEALSDTQIAFRIQERIKAGVATRIIVPSNVLGAASQAVLNALKAVGAQIKLLDKPYIHAKMILVDGERGFVGSENATANSLDKNREVGVLWQNAEVARTLAATFQSDWTAGTPF